MIKQGIKMKERNTAFLLILITTDLHVGILSSRSLEPRYSFQDSGFCDYYYSLISHGYFWFTIILWHHLMKSQKRCTKSQQHIFLKWSICSRTNALTSLCPPARARAAGFCVDWVHWHSLGAMPRHNLERLVRRSGQRKVNSDRLPPSRLHQGYWTGLSERLLASQRAILGQQAGPHTALRDWDRPAAPRRGKYSPLWDDCTSRRRGQQTHYIQFAKMHLSFLLLLEIFQMMNDILYIKRIYSNDVSQY